MDTSTTTLSNPLEHMLDRSNELHEHLMALLENAEFDGSDRGIAALGLCHLAIEHSAALRILLASGLPTA